VRSPQKKRAPRHGGSWGPFNDCSRTRPGSKLRRDHTPKPQLVFLRRYWTFVETEIAVPPMTASGRPARGVGRRASLPIPFLLRLGRRRPGANVLRGLLGPHEKKRTPALGQRDGPGWRKKLLKGTMVLIKRTISSRNFSFNTLRNSSSDHYLNVFFSTIIHGGPWTPKAASGEQQTSENDNLGRHGRVQGTSGGEIKSPPCRKEESVATWLRG